MSFGTPVRLGPERILNTTYGGSQFEPHVTALADGRFVAVWTDSSLSGADTSSYAVRMRVFNADGTEAVAERLVNTEVMGAQQFARVTALHDGGFLVVWYDPSGLGGDASSGSIRAQAFSASGVPSPVGERVVNVQTQSSQYDPQVTTLADGRVLVTWTDTAAVPDADPSGYNIRGRILSATGVPTGGEIAINTQLGSIQFDGSVAALPDGGFVAVWADLSIDGGAANGYGLAGRVFSASGTPTGTDFRVNQTYASDQLDPTITALAGGGFVVAWMDFSMVGADASSAAVRARVFGEGGAWAAPEFVVNTTTSNSQLQPEIAALSDGRFVVVWTDHSASGADTSSAAVRAQVFGADGTKHGSEFVANSVVANSQHEPSVTELADGRILTAWSDTSMQGGDPVSAAVKSHIFDPRVGPAILHGSELNDQFMGTGWSDDLSGFDGNDSLWGLAGDDRLNGEAGNDRVLGGEGRDRVWGDGGNDTLLGDGGHDRVFGGDGDDKVEGGFGDDYLSGSAGSDSLGGNAGRDRLSGGAGLDQLRGGAGADQFVFDTAREAAAMADRIRDFDPVQDLILIDDARFAGVGAPGRISAALFKDLDSGAADASDRILYDTTGTGASRVGTLFYDPDGSGAGARVAFVVLDGGPALTVSDIFVI